MKPKVSIIIPVYNSEKYIARCIESVLNQTFDDYEIILINDGSKDKSKEILDEYKEKYPEKINVIHQENKGVAKTRNYGIRIANGEFIAFIDNDDFIDKDYLETFIKSTKEGEYDAIIAGYRRPNQDGKIVRKLQLKDEQWCKMMILAPWAKIYKKDYLLKNNIEFLSNNIGEDIYFNLQALLLSDKIKVIDYIGYNWFFNTESVTNTIQKNITNLQVYELLNNCYNVVKEKGILNKNYELIEMHFIRYVMWILSFATKGLNYKVISEEYDKIFDWLKERFPNYKKNKMIGLRKPKGEILALRLLYLTFMICHKLKFGKLVVWLYSKV